MKTQKLMLVLSGVLLSIPAGAAALRCEDVFRWEVVAEARLQSARDPIIKNYDDFVWSWAQKDKTRLRPFAPAIVKNLIKEKIVMTVLGGSSIHSILPGENASAKIYFKQGGPRTMEELASLIVDASLVSLDFVSSRSQNGEPLVLVVPAPGQVMDGGNSIKLPGNFGELGNKVFEMTKLVEAEITRRAETDPRVKQMIERGGVRVFAKNDSFPLSAKIDGKLIFGGTGLGESNVQRNKANGTFKDLPTESGHLRLTDYPGLAVLLPKPLLKAAELIQKIHGNEHIEFENLAAGGRPGHHLSGILSVLVSEFLPAEHQPAWIRTRREPGDANTKVAWQTFAASVLKDPGAARNLQLEHPADRALVARLMKNEVVQLEHVSEAASKGGPIATLLLRSVIYTQGLVSGVMATEFGATPSGDVVPASFALGEKGVSREVHVRADGAFSAWGPHLADANGGFKAGIDSQFFGNPEYVAKLKAEGKSPSQLRPNSFKLIYGSKDPFIADADLECLLTLSRRNFVP